MAKSAWALFNFYMNVTERETYIQNSKQSLEHLWQPQHY